MFKLSNVVINSVAVTGVQGANLDPGFAAMVMGAAGNYQGDFNAVIRQMAKVGFSAFDLGLQETPLLTQVALIYRALVEGSVPGATYISLTGTAAKCLVVPQGITWSAGGVATKSFLVHFMSSDGDVPPFTVAATAGATTAITNVYVADDGCVESVSLNYGYEVRFCNDGKLYPRLGYIISQRPTLSVTTTNQASVTTANINPGAVGTLTAAFALATEGGVRGAGRSYSLTGHLSRSISQDRPGVVTINCQGKGGFTVS